MKQQTTIVLEKNK